MTPTDLHRPGVFALYNLLTRLQRGSVAVIPVGNFAKGGHIFGAASCLDLGGPSVRVSAWDVSAGSGTGTEGRMVLRLAVWKGLVHTTIPKFPVTPLESNRLILPDIAKAVPNPDVRIIDELCVTYSPIRPESTSQLWSYKGRSGPTHYWEERPFDPSSPPPAVGILRSMATGHAWGYLK